MAESLTRRHLLATVGVATAAGVAGCLTGGDGPTGDSTDADDGDADPADGGSADGGDEDGSTTDGSADADATSSDTTAGAGETSADDALDLREANVTDVALDAQGGGDVRFSVTLIHDDDGEDGYANWWAVETRDGEEIGRRDLAHAHGTQAFTRSTTVSVPDAVDCVVVRGHDQTHDYGGQAAVVSLASGATRFVQQGGDGASFAGADCP